MVEVGDAYTRTAVGPCGLVTIKYVGDTIVVFQANGVERYDHKKTFLLNYTKVEPFFEVGKTYERRGFYDFKCVAVVESEGYRVAVGHYHWPCDSWGPLVTRTNFTNWSEK